MKLKLFCLQNWELFLLGAFFSLFIGSFSVLRFYITEFLADLIIVGQNL